MSQQAMMTQILQTTNRLNDMVHLVTDGLAGHHFLSDLIGMRAIAIADSGWVGDGGEVGNVEGIIRAVAVERGFILLVQDDAGRLCVVRTMTHDIVIV